MRQQDKPSLASSYQRKVSCWAASDTEVAEETGCKQCSFYTILSSPSPRPLTSVYPPCGSRGCLYGSTADAETASLAMKQGRAQSGSDRGSTPHGRWHTMHADY